MFEPSRRAWGLSWFIEEQRDYQCYEISVHRTVPIFPQVTVSRGIVKLQETCKIILSFSRSLYVLESSFNEDKDKIVEVVCTSCFALIYVELMSLLQNIGL